ncbi:hypothetical protein [Amycolatopsis sp. NPDC001319]|uniref:hypothetical protein n=1 Tax=unclassified Amycolatopsis TaxID=2618356 RepID=UPI0036927B50
MPTDDLREPISQLRRIEAALRVGVAVRLLQWAGLGDWRHLSTDGRAHAGARAVVFAA